MPKPQSPLQEQSQENPPTTHSNHDSLKYHSLSLGDSCDTNVGQALIPPQSANQTQLTQHSFPHLLINPHMASMLHAQTPPSSQGDNQTQPPLPPSPSREMLIDDINQLQDLLNISKLHARISCKDCAFLSFAVYTGAISSHRLLRAFKNRFGSTDEISTSNAVPGSQQKVIRKEVIFVVDTSGSMKGRTIEATKSVVMLKLDQGDSYNVMAFSDQTYPYSSTLELATKEALKKATNWIDMNFIAGGARTCCVGSLFPVSGKLNQRDAGAQLVVSFHLQEQKIGFLSTRRDNLIIQLARLSKWCLANILKNLEPDQVIDFRGLDFHEPTPDVLAYMKQVFVKAMAETGQIKLSGEQPTLTETALYRA
ncbi:copia protein [Tanacetum coccineum]